MLHALELAEEYCDVGRLWGSLHTLPSAWPCVTHLSDCQSCPWLRTTSLKFTSNQATSTASPSSVWFFSSLYVQAEASPEMTIFYGFLIFEGWRQTQMASPQ